MSEPRFRTEKGLEGSHMAAYFDDPRLAGAMIEKKRGFVLNAQTSNGETAVHWAAFYGHASVLRVLIDKGADLDTKGNLKRTAVHKATMNDDQESVRMILESKRVNTQIEDGQESIVQLLL
ncbi:ankyrin repeat-containing domain protein [Xylaria telfairii]|nr:ankyrin repeat-containing domain protein [Xylaria telfairii]